MPQIIKPSTLNKVWASSGDRATPLDSKISAGWQVEIPPRQWFNWLDHRQDQAIAHINQHGIAVWDNQTEYQANRSYAQDPVDGIVYRCTVTNTGNRPGASPSMWRIAFADGTGEALIPAGAVTAFAMNTAPLGWLKANGAAVSRTVYADLFAAIGVTYGAGNGSSTFNLPDLRGEFVRGWDDGRGIDAGRAFGNIQLSQNISHTHSGTANSAGNHTHSVTGVANSAGAHTHTTNIRRQVWEGRDGISGDMATDVGTSSNFNYTSNSAGTHTHSLSGTANSAGAHTHSLSINASGGNEARPRNITLLYCIKY